MSEVVGGNRFTLLHNGAEYFPALEAAIDQAQAFVYLESYICVNDNAGKRIAAALTRAAQRGVATHFLVDGFGAQTYSNNGIAALRTAGVRALVYRPYVSSYRFFRQRLRRLHRKLAVIDQRWAFVGGINIVDDAVRPGAAPRFDYAVQIEGPLVAPILKEVSRLHAHVLRSQGMPLEASALPLTPPFEQAGSQRGKFLKRSNLHHRRDIERDYLRAIAQARKEIIIANAYFLPGRRFRKVLRRAVERGVHIRLLLQGNSDHPWVQYASRGLYDQLLSAGIEIYEYQPSELHAKVAVIDGEWATVGSSNIDPLSLMMSREANVIVFDAGFAQQLRESLNDAIHRESRAITLQHWQSRPRSLRILSSFILGMVRLAAGWVGYGIAD